jgi:hypothetical protein
MSGFLRTARRYNLEDCTLHSHRCEDLKPNNLMINETFFIDTANGQIMKINKYFQLDIKKAYRSI